MEHLRIEKKLGFDQIRNLVMDYCRGPIGRGLAKEMRFRNKLTELQEMEYETREMLDLVLNLEAPTQPEYEDPDEVFKKLQIKDAYLVEREFSLVRNFMQIYSDWKNCLKNQEEPYPNLENQILGIDFPSFLHYRIDEVIDEHSLVRSSASPELNRIRKKTSRLREKTRDSISRSLQKAKDQGFSNPESEWSLRNGRFVIPLSVAFKRSMDGFIMDYSGSGQTAFLEPREVFQLNNELIDLLQDEKEEIIRILKELTDECRKNQVGLSQTVEICGRLDFLRAKSFLGADLKACIPETGTVAFIDLKNARHPLLFLSHEKEGKEVVPLSLKLDKDNRMIIISGPNAGGKSVALKTVGLIQYMFQSGLPVPVDEKSTLGIFDSFFVDIGDDQSIENDLSTYSSHMVTMTRALKGANSKSLILFDEFGAGTDPLIGGAIGEALLKEFNKKGCFGILNTHYPNLKKLADSEEGVENGAMSFDQEKMRPTFKFTLGQAGSSFALEIAQRAGLPPNILKAAKQIGGKGFMDFDRLLAENQEKATQLADKKKELEELKTSMEKEATELNSRLKGIKKERKEIIDKAKEDALKVIESSNQKIEETIRKIRESQADPNETKNARKELQVEKKKLAQEKEPKKDPGTSKGEIKLNSWVVVRPTGQRGRLIDLKKKNGIVEIGDLKVQVGIENLMLSEDQSPKNPVTGSGPSRKLKVKSVFKTEIDIRGLRAGEATTEVLRFLDEAQVANSEQLRIIHGRGDGHLRKLVAELLNQSKGIKSFLHETEEFGGDGVTLIHLSK